MKQTLMKQTLMKCRRNQMVSNESGQAILEFALTSLLTFLLVFGMIDFSRAVYTASIVQWAAQQGARAGIVDTDSVVTTVEEKFVLLDPARATITVTTPETDVVQVAVVYDFDFIVPIISAIVEDGLELRGTASMIRH